MSLFDTFDLDTGVTTSDFVPWFDVTGAEKRVPVTTTLQQILAGTYAGGGLTNWEETGNDLGPVAGNTTGNLTVPEDGSLFAANAQFYGVSTNRCTVRVDGSSVAGFRKDAGIVLPHDHSLAFSPTSDPGNSTRDIFLERIDAGHLGLRDGANPQTFSVANTDDGAGNYERALLSWQEHTGAFEINVQKGGTGTTRYLTIAVDGSPNLACDNAQNIFYKKAFPQTVLDLGRSSNPWGTIYGTDIRTDSASIGKSGAQGSVNVLSNTGAGTLQLSGHAIIGGLYLGSGAGINWDSSAAVSGSVDLSLERIDAGHLGLRDDANPQAFSVANTDDGAGNYERSGIWWDSNTLYHGQQFGGTGVGRQMFIWSESDLFLRTGSTAKSLIFRFGGSNRYTAALNSFHPATSICSLGTEGSPWGNLYLAPTTTPTLTTNESMAFELVNDTTVRLHHRGSDGTTRTVDFTTS